MKLTKPAQAIELRSLSPLLDAAKKDDVNGSRAPLEIIWNGELVGYLEDADLETIDVARSYKTRGRWVPLEVPATDAFLRLLKESPRLDVRVNEGTPGMTITFSMGLDGEAWLYSRDLIRWKRFRAP